MNNFIKRVAFSLLIICIMFSNAILVFAEKKSNEIIVSNNFAEQNLQEEGEIGEVEIVQEPKKIDYNVGEKFKPAGLKFKLPSGKTITYSALNASSFRFEPSINEELTSDIECIEVTYKDYKFDIQITVYDSESDMNDANDSNNSEKTRTEKVQVNDGNVYGSKPEMEDDESDGVEIIQLPKQTDYKVGDKFKPNGLKFKLPNGKTVTYSMLNSYMFKFDPTANTELTSDIESIKVVYGEYTFNIPIAIDGKNLDGNSQEDNSQGDNGSEGNNADSVLVYDTIKSKGIEQLPTRVKYKVGDKFNPSGLKIKLENGKIVSYNAANNHLFKFSPKTTEGLEADLDHVEVIYQDGGNDSGQLFYIPIEMQKKIVKVSSNTDALYCSSGQPFNPTGLALTLEMDDGTIETVVYNENTKDDFSFEPNCVGDTVVDGTQITVSYKDTNMPLEMSIWEAKKPVIVYPPHQLVYKSGEKFNPNGLELYMQLDGSGWTNNWQVDTWDGTIQLQDMFVLYDDGVISSKEYEGWNGNADQFTFEPSLDTPLTTQGNSEEEIEIKIHHIWTNHVYTQKVKVLPSVHTQINKDDTNEKDIADEDNINDSANKENISVEWHLDKNEYWKWEKFEPTGYLIINKNGDKKRVEYNKDTQQYFSFDGKTYIEKVKYPNGESKTFEFPLAPGKILWEDVSKGIKITYNDGEINSTKSISVKDCPCDVKLDVSSYSNKYKVGDLRNLDPINFVFTLPDGSVSTIPFKDANEQGLVFVPYLYTPLTKENYTIDIWCSMDSGIPGWRLITELTD